MTRAARLGGAECEREKCANYIEENLLFRFHSFYYIGLGAILIGEFSENPFIFR